MRRYFVLSILVMVGFVLSGCPADDDPIPTDTVTKDGITADTPTDKGPVTGDTADDKGTPTDEGPADEGPAEDTPDPPKDVPDPPKDVPVEDTPVDVPVEDVPVEDVPDDDVPVEDVPVEDVPVEDVPTPDIPVEDTPPADVLVEDVTGPDGWTCEPAAHDDDEDMCDCGCGILDPDCDDGTIGACATVWCEVYELPVADSNWLCETPIPDWTCPPGYYDDEMSICDCGCGVIDPNCPGPTADGCFNNCPDGQAPVADQNWLCEEVDLPDGWICDADYYEDGDCDCGCGAKDADCASDSADDCVYQSCPDGEQVVADQNWLCETVQMPEGWTCMEDM